MKRSWIWIIVLALAGTGVVGATRVLAKPSPDVLVHVQSSPNILRNVHISFRPTDRLPPGGYYYAVIVLQPYGHYTRSEPPPCATSSDMSRTHYGYSYDHRKVVLTLGSAESRTGHWCRGGTYIGGIYAVPHPPPCAGDAPCIAEPYAKGSPCHQFADGQRVCGVAPVRRYFYPNGLPIPTERSTRIVGHFQVIFPDSH